MILSMANTASSAQRSVKPILSGATNHFEILLENLPFRDDLPETKRHVVMTSNASSYEARTLLYDCYVEHMKWDIAPDNPSSILIQNWNGRNILTDDYDHRSVWFSMADDEENCMACARLCFNDSNGLLEVERYENAKASLSEIMKKKRSLNILEFNREAVVLEKIYDKKIYLALLKSAFQYCINGSHTFFTATWNAQWVGVYAELGMPQFTGCMFKYNDSDPHPVRVYLATPFEIERILKKVDALLERD